MWRLVENPKTKKKLTDWTFKGAWTKQTINSVLQSLSSLKEKKYPKNHCGKDKTWRQNLEIENLDLSMMICLLLWRA